MAMSALHTSGSGLKGMCNYSEVKSRLYPLCGVLLHVLMKGSGRGRQQGKAPAAPCCRSFSLPLSCHSLSLLPESLAGAKKGYSGGEAVGHYFAKSSITGQVESAVGYTWKHTHRLLV